MKVLVCSLVSALLVCSVYSEDAKATAEKPKGKRGLVDLGYGLGSSDLGLGLAGHGLGLGLAHSPAVAVHSAPAAIIGEPIVKSVVITKEVPVGIPQPYPVPVIKHVAVPIDRPVHVIKHVPVPVDRPVPVAVPVHVKVPVPVIKHVGIPVDRPIAVPVVIKDHHLDLHSHYNHY